MDNEYNYYIPGNDEKREGYQPYRPELSEEPHNQGKKHSRRKVPKGVTVVAWACVFGLVASLVFTGGSLALNKMTGASGKTVQVGSTSDNSTEDSSTKLIKTSSVTVSDVSSVVEKTMPSIVSITNMSVQQVQSFFGTSEQQAESVGSGIILGQNDTELLMVTNNHVVDGYDTLTVTFHDDNSVEAKVKGTDASKDLAVVAVKLSDISEDTMNSIAIAQTGDSSTLKAGEPVIAIGNALGYGQSVTTGVVSATDREIDGYGCKLIQTDAAINPGNSGGALLNTSGEVVGINSAKIQDTSVEGMGYATQISDVSDIIEGLMNQTTKDKVREADRGYLGIRGTDVDATTAQMYSLPTGVYVSEVVSGGAADKAGLTEGSIITKLNDTAVDSMTTLQSQLEYYAAGEEVTLAVNVPKDKSGNYEEQTIKVTLEKQSNQ